MPAELHVFFDSLLEFSFIRTLEFINFLAILVELESGHRCDSNFLGNIFSFVHKKLHLVCCRLVPGNH